MESWETVGSRKKTTKADGQGHRPGPSGVLLGGMNRRQGERSGAEEPNNGATRQYPTPLLEDGQPAGSFHPKADLSASARVCPHGYAYVARTPGRQAIYKAEVIGVLLDAHFSPPRSPLFTENQRVKKGMNHDKPALKDAYWVELARAELKRKGSPLEREKAHSNFRGNELAAHFANLGTKLPLPLGSLGLSNHGKSASMASQFSPPPQSLAPQPHPQP